MKEALVILGFLALTLPCSAIQGDITLDGKVDSYDFATLSKAWKSHSGEPKWNYRCDISEPNDNIIDHLDLAVLSENWLSNVIRLDVYSDGWGTLLETMAMTEEGDIIISVEEEYPYYEPPEYYIYASRKGSSTELYYCQKDDTISVDLDETIPGRFNGVIFMTSGFFADSYLENIDVYVYDVSPPGDPVDDFQTDQQGRFDIDPLPEGIYSFEFDAIGDEPEYHLEEVYIQGQYQEFYFPWHIQAEKPNIYLYPEQTTQLDINITFPHGGYVTTAIPDYDNGWDVIVEPSGIINGQYEFLFYESSQPDYCQYENGWVLATEQLETFFTNNMTLTGFNPKEINDFVAYWIPRFTDWPYYAIYPQYNNELDDMIKLEFSTQPQNLIRLIYTVRGLENNNLNL